MGGVSPMPMFDFARLGKMADLTKMQGKDAFSPSAKDPIEFPDVAERMIQDMQKIVDQTFGQNAKNVKFAPKNKPELLQFLLELHNHFKRNPHQPVSLSQKISIKPEGL
jgi:hypothetical protein